MPIPSVLKDYVDLLRTGIRTANHRTSTLKTNAATYTNSIRPYVQMSPAIDAALVKAEAKAQELAKQLSSISASVERPGPEVARSRQEALIALDALEAVLADAKSAGHLGYHW